MELEARGYWPEPDPDTDQYEVPRHDAVVASATTYPWLNALPFAAVVIEVSGGKLSRFAYWNTAFATFMPALVTGQVDMKPKWASAYQDIIAKFVEERPATRHFGVERQGNLGPEHYAATLTWLEVPDANGGGTALLSLQDHTTASRIERNLRRELVSDQLTTLPNRIGFNEEVERMIASGELDDNLTLMVMMIDLVGFSRINESLGALEGDALLMSVASRLRDTVDRAICIARTGGDEFAVCCPLANGVTDVLALGERIRSAIAHPSRLGGYQVSIDCAIGCSVAPVKEADAEDLLRQAQSALRTAKRSDRLEVYRVGVMKAAQRRFQIEGRLREALATGGLELAYQPLMDLETGTIMGFEALARWNDAELGAVSPVEFIPVAEESGLIVPLGRWTLNEALQQLVRWELRLGSALPIKMSVNLSPIQTARDDVISTVLGALRLNGVDGSKLMIELTESAVIDDPENCRKLLTALKSYNVAIAMDDFGTGFSNMANLQSLPIDVLKIDRSFVTNMLEDADKQAIVRAILSLASSLKMKATAEGVESQEVADTLRTMGCTTGQGYHFAKPMPADEAYAYLLARWNSDTV